MATKGSALASVDSEGTPTIVGPQAPLPVTDALGSTGAKQDAILAELELKADLTETQPVGLHDGAGNPITSLNGAIDVHDADVHTILVNRYMHQHAAASTTLTVAPSADDIQITVSSVVGFSVGDYLQINTTIEETTHPSITAIAGNVITLDRRLDFAHVVGDLVEHVIIDMADPLFIGSLATPQIYWAGPPAGEVWHLTRILFAMGHGSAGDLGLFGDIAALTNGLTIRSIINGQQSTLTSWKINGDIKVDFYDVDFDVRSGGGGTHGTSGRGTFKNAGVVVSLDGDNNDRLQVYVQDDISALDFFNMKAQGHIEGV